jgi:hypothetical protein
VKVWWLLAAWLAASHARAEVSTIDRADRAYFLGVNVRSDRATHSTRFGTGIRIERVALNVVLDPVGYQATGEQSDTDAFVEVDIWRQLAVFGGWRVGKTPIFGTQYWHHRAFTGIAAPLPSLFWGHVRVRVAAEVATTLVKHGEDLPTMTALDTRTYAWGFFVRAEIGRGF